jgi:hypothetical protein
MARPLSLRGGDEGRTKGDVRTRQSRVSLDLPLEPIMHCSPLLNVFLHAALLSNHPHPHFIISGISYRSAQTASWSWFGTSLPQPVLSLPFHTWRCIFIQTQPDAVEQTDTFDALQSTGNPGPH